MTNSVTDKERATYLCQEIEKLAKRPLRLMEVCGTHTVAIFRAGLRQILPEKIQLVSGPGCPVCVTPTSFIDAAIYYSRQPEMIITTFGDMLRVPGSASSLIREKASGADIRIVYSPLDALTVAKENPEKKVIFLAVGFETTAPTVAATILTAKDQKLANFFILSAHKLVPPALRALLDNHDSRVDGFLLPGNVCAITGEKPYHFLGKEYQIPAVITGFSPLTILEAVYQLVLKLDQGDYMLANRYQEVVRSEGNPVALELLEKVFTPCDTVWRGLGEICCSGLTLSESYRSFAIEETLPFDIGDIRENSLCRCGDVLKGRITPKECPLFGKGCSPGQPVGACMVSVEGTCAAWYKYGNWRWEK